MYGTSGLPAYWADLKRDSKNISPKQVKIGYWILCTPSILMFMGGFLAFLLHLGQSATDKGGRSDILYTKALLCLIIAGIGWFSMLYVFIYYKVIYPHVYK